MLFIPIPKNMINVIADLLLNQYSATRINFAQLLSAQAKQAREIYFSFALLDIVFVLFSIDYTQIFGNGITLLFK